MSEEKSKNTIESGAATLADASPGGGAVGASVSAGAATTSTAVADTPAPRPSGDKPSRTRDAGSPAADSAGPVAGVRPSLAGDASRRRLWIVVALIAALFAFINLIGWGIFGVDTVKAAAVPLVLLVGCFTLFGVAGYRGKKQWMAIAVIGLILVMWHHAFGEMFHRWFPGWDTYKAAPLTTRLTAGDSYFTHAPLVPVICLGIAYLIYKRVGLPAQRTRRSNVVGGIVLGVSLLLQIAASRGDVTFVAGYAMIGVLIGLVLLWGGTPLLRAYWLPIAFLVFMVPFPMDTIYKLNYRLRVTASEAAVYLTNKVFAVPAILADNKVVLPPDPITGAEKSLVVANVCSGLRSMIALTCFASLFALVCRVKGWWRLLMLALAFPAAIACNIVRITSMDVVAHHWSVEAAGEDSWFHMFSGIMVFALALGFLFGVERLIIFFSNKYNKNWTDDRLLGYLDNLPPSQPKQVRPFRPVALASIVIVAAYSVLWAYDESTVNRSDVARHAVPAELTIGGELNTSVDMEMPPKVLSILQTTDYLSRRYTDQYGKQVDLSIIFSKNNRKGTHPPEVCIEGSGGQIVGKQLHTVAFETEDEAGQHIQREVAIRELISHDRRTGVNMLHMYLYKCGDSYTTNYIWQQVTIFFNGVLNRNASGALIRIDVPIGQRSAVNEAAARQYALTAAKAFMPHIDKGLP